MIISKKINNTRNIWIIKPVDDLDNKEFKLFETLQDILSHLLKILHNKKDKGKNRKKKY